MIQILKSTQQKKAGIWFDKIGYLITRFFLWNNRLPRGSKNSEEQK